MRYHTQQKLESNERGHGGEGMRSPLVEPTSNIPRRLKTGDKPPREPFHFRHILTTHPNLSLGVQKM